MAEATRREFMARTAATAGTVWPLLVPSKSQAAAAKRKMTIDLRPGGIGVRGGLRAIIELAYKYGFESVSPEVGQLQKLSDGPLTEIRQSLKKKGLVFGAAGLPVEFRQDQSRFETGIKTLPDAATALRRAGVTRVGTWLPPTHRKLTFRKNFKRHVERLGQCAKILGDHGVRLGLEYVGPKTLWASQRFPFVHTMIETKELIEAIGHDNVGFVLDSWHWYTAHETVDDILSLKNSDVVAVDLNDAPSGLTVDEQIDNKRELPTTTGVIDLSGFLNALNQIGYDGPVRAEPFNQKLLQLPGTEEKVAAVAKHMKKAFALIR